MTKVALTYARDGLHDPSPYRGDAPVSATAWFLRPTPMTDLRTQLSVVSEGGRVSVIDNTLWPVGDDQPCATVRLTLSRERAVEIPGFTEATSAPVDPTRFPLRSPPRRPRPRLVHGRHGGARQR